MCEVGAVWWIAEYFDDCIRTPRDWVSFVIGMISNVLFLVCAFPQIHHNYVTKDTDGQSPFFFSLSFTGSSLNFIAAIITHALVTQLLSGFLYVLTDGILLCQFLAYRYFFKRNGEGTGEVTAERPDNIEPVGNEMPRLGVVAGVALMAAKVSAVDYAEPYTGGQLTGAIFAWICALIFNACRVPQIIKNAQDQCMEGFSLWYISMTMMGNVTYVASVIIRKIDANYMWKQAPFLVSALGPLIFDMIILGQRWYYGSRTNDESEGREEVQVTGNDAL
jgi:uncharacterized protein with PQ loop repeat